MRAIPIWTIAQAAASFTATNPTRMMPMETSTTMTLARRSMMRLATMLAARKGTMMLAKTTASTLMMSTVASMRARMARTMESMAALTRTTVLATGPVREQSRAGGDRCICAWVASGPRLLIVCLSHRSGALRSRGGLLFSCYLSHCVVQCIIYSSYFSVKHRINREIHMEAAQPSGRHCGREALAMPANLSWQLVALPPLVNEVLAALLAAVTESVRAASEGLVLVEEACELEVCVDQLALAVALALGPLPSVPAAGRCVGVDALAIARTRRPVPRVCVAICICVRAHARARILGPLTVVVRTIGVVEHAVAVLQIVHIAPGVLCTVLEPVRPRAVPLVVMVLPLVHITIGQDRLAESVALLRVGVALALVCPDGEHMVAVLRSVVRHGPG
eukprot:m.103393 g.103393  ORF g.103393 m.103393 type:complete len:392 (-) comp8849_c0_seq1:34-1209(-)